MDDIKYNNYDGKYVPSPFGLINTGAICWCNSAIQSLLSCAQFNYMMIENKEKLKNNKVATTYIEIIEELLKDDKINENECRSISTRMLNSIIIELKKQKRKSDLLSFGQKDASDGILIFLELIDCRPVSNLFLHRYENASLCMKCKKVSFVNTKEPPNIANEITFREEITTEQEFLKKLLMHWTPNDGIMCEKCKEKTDESVIVYTLKMVRELLMILIMNTTEGTINPNNLIKNEIPLHRFKYPYPEHIYMPTNKKSKLKYKLVSMIEQLGGRRYQSTPGNRASSTSSGHYVATCFRQGKYWDFNDTSVTSSKFKQSQNAYVLIYSLLGEVNEG